MIQLKTTIGKLLQCNHKSLSAIWYNTFMDFYDFGKNNSSNVLIQPVDDHELKLIESEVKLLGELFGNDFCLVAAKIDDWNKELSPWRSPAVFGNDDFGDGAAETLIAIEGICTDSDKNYCLGGYSLAALFSLWAAYQTDLFSGIAAASPSVWFPGFTNYIKENRILTNAVYLSLGDREERTKNPVMRTVGDCIRQTYESVKDQGIKSTLEWNEGNHFRDVDIRCAKAFSWLLKNAS